MFYETKYTGRKLSWLYNMSLGEWREGGNEGGREGWRLKKEEIYSFSTA